MSIASSAGASEIAKEIIDLIEIEISEHISEEATIVTLNTLKVKIEKLKTSADNGWY